MREDDDEKKKRHELFYKNALVCFMTSFTTTLLTLKLYGLL